MTDKTRERIENILAKLSEVKMTPQVKLKEPWWKRWLPKYRKRQKLLQALVDYNYNKSDFQKMVNEELLRRIK